MNTMDVDHICIACRSDDLEPFLLPSKDQAVKCRECGLVWALNRQTPADFYESAYDGRAEGFTWDGYLATHKNMKAGETIRSLWFENHFLNNVAPFDRKNLLEIGCGIGRFLYAARHKGWNVYGLDISEKAVSLAKEIFSEADIQCSTIDSAAWPENFFEAITFWEVIEHVHDPLLLLNQSANLLKQNGILTFSTPDWDSWAIRRHPMVNYWPPYHLWFFNEKSLRHLVQRTGMEIIQVKRRLFPWSEACWPKWKRLLGLPFLIWKGIILRQGGGRLVIYARKK